MSNSDSKSDEALSQSIPSIDRTATSATAASSSTTTTTPTSVYFVGFNQDHSCFAAGVDRGFRIYSCNPYKSILEREFSTAQGGGAGVSTVGMLFRCNIMAVVGGGPQPLHPTNKVMIWDDHASRYVGELSFRSEVRSVKLRSDRIFVVLMQSVFAYNFEDFRLVQQLETVANPKGLLEVSQSAGPNAVMVCPGLQKGQVRVELYGLKKTLFVTAHDSKVVALALTLDGRLMATASSKGTLVRVFNTSDGSLLQEVRRGADRAEIYNIAFSCNANWSNQWLAVSSDKGTVHVFNLKVDSGLLRNKDRSSKSAESKLAIVSRMPSLSVFKGVLPRYFSSEWSVAQFRLPEGLQHIVGFGFQKNTVLIIGMNGSFYRCQFDPVKGGEMTQLEHYNFLKPEESL